MRLRQTMQDANRSYRENFHRPPPPSVQPLNPRKGNKSQEKFDQGQQL
jgi:hypothetical protein